MKLFSFLVRVVIGVVLMQWSGASIHLTWLGSPSAFLSLPPVSLPSSFFLPPFNHQESSSSKSLTMASVHAQYPPVNDRPVKDTICLFDVDGTLTPARRVRPASRFTYVLRSLIMAYRLSPPRCLSSFVSSARKSPSVSSEEVIWLSNRSSWESTAPTVPSTYPTIPLLSRTRC
jgi:hypothetical protein